MRALVDAIYTDIAPWAPEKTRWMFKTARTDKLKEHYGLLVAWADSIRKVFPEKYKEVHSSICTNDVLGRELEYALARKAGPLM